MPSPCGRRQPEQPHQWNRDMGTDIFAPRANRHSRARSIFGAGCAGTSRRCYRHFWSRGVGAGRLPGRVRPAPQIVQTVLESESHQKINPSRAASSRRPCNLQQGRDDGVTLPYRCSNACQWRQAADAVRVQRLYNDSEVKTWQEHHQFILISSAMVRSW